MLTLTRDLREGQSKKLPMGVVVSAIRVSAIEVKLVFQWPDELRTDAERDTAAVSAASVLAARN